MYRGQRTVEPVRVLRNVALFDETSDELVEDIAEALIPISVGADTVVCREGEPADAFYLVRSGSLGVTTTIAGVTRELSRMSAGDFFGEVALVGGSSRTATVTALGPAELWKLDTENFWSLVGRDTWLAQQIEERARARKTRSFEVTRHDLAALMDQRSMLRIGRDLSNDLVVDSPLVSQFHVVLRRDGAGFRIEDQDSSTGTFVNGRRVQSVALSPGDEISIGDESLYFEPSGIVRVALPPGLRIDAVGLSYDIKAGVRLLHEIDLSILPGELVAILGGSGAGKSTLMNALAGVTSATSGTLRYNGHHAYAERERFRNVIGYVPQDDIVHPELSTRRTLAYAAQLRLPADTPRSHREQAVDDTLSQLGLTERANLAVRGLSGGQRKRCSIGVELLTNPRAFFLDEPTSGLDPLTDKGIMRTLRELADAGSTIVMTTHNTTNVDMCDRVVFLTSGGRLAYAGPPQSALAYFGAPDFESIYEILVNDGTPEEWQERFSTTAPEQPTPTDATSPTIDDDDAPESEPGRRQSVFRQFAVLSRRNIEVHTRSTELVIPLIVQPIAFSLLLVLLFDAHLYQADEPKPLAYVQLLFFMGFFGFMAAVLNSSQEIVRELAIFRRERMVGIRVLPYVTSKLAFFVPALFIINALIIGILRFSNRLPAEGLSVYGSLLVTMMVTSMCGAAIGLMISSMTSDSQAANDLMALFLVPQVLFGGGLIAVGSMNIAGRAISHVVPLRWAFEAIGRNLGVDDVLDANPSGAASEVQAQYGSAFTGSAVVLWLVLALFIIVPIALAFLRLHKQSTLD